jgi:bud site selection protein 20
MGGVYRRKKTHHGRLEFYRKCRLRNRTKDLDQIQEDLVPQNREKLLKAVLDEDLPGGGEFLCVECR